MRERFQVSDQLYGALLIYAAISTLLPSLVLARPVDFNVLVGPLPDAQQASEQPVDRGDNTARSPAQAETGQAANRTAASQGGPPVSTR